MSERISINEGRYYAGDVQLSAGMTILRLDSVDGNWYEGYIGRLTIGEVSSLALVVEGYVPSPLQTGQEVEILSSEEAEDAPVAENEQS